MVVDNKAVRKYLARYATEDVKLAGSVAGDFGHTVVVPARDEEPGFVAQFRQVLGDDALIILIVNHQSDSATTVVAGNRRLAASAAHIPGVLVVEKCLPKDEGVGLARRIGCDIALALWAEGRVRSPWIHSTDADVFLPADYLTSTRLASEHASALVYPFWHVAAGDKLVDQATALYEMSLRYYVLGLRYARSPQAFHTVGSALCVRAQNYAEARGVPRRQAGEDFYLLNKLAKLGRVERAQSAPIQIRSRHSDRVPFGTGPAVRRIAERLRGDRPMTVYHPEIFARLREHLRSIGDRPRAHEQFDAFRTLKFVHGLRNAGLANVPWDEACRQAPFVPDVARGDLRQALFDAET